ncbi:MaoC family dehydratase N-terminal domain-containing protein [Nocardioides sp. Y6]|uniref:MaoC family dehydratase N-terminal domain-containing protein n=1 Tax=Nocardioides malaquae TaxID=2773426 RepID=A0ABR9RV19_9ACTN|nr:MaoC/PaaZ C-terminal domain-containing protein [Nocardioides malaquae]MBE7325401.1 MaoC family dehydratase N-terminal domain-containing protein [Nocardioides malaquae]
MTTTPPVVPAEGDALPERTFTITRADLVAYAEASGDHNPIHSDEEVAQAVGLPGVIAHGMLTLGLVARAVTEWFPGAEVVELGSKFTHPVVVPAEGAAEVVVAATVKTVEAAGDERAVDDSGATLVRLQLTATHDGTKVLGMPKALLRLP